MRRTARQTWAAKWLLCYFLWFVLLLIWNAGWFDFAIPRADMGNCLTYMIILLIIAAILQR